MPRVMLIDAEWFGDAEPDGVVKLSEKLIQEFGSPAVTQRSEADRVTHFRWEEAHVADADQLQARARELAAESGIVIAIDQYDT